MARRVSPGIRIFQLSARTGEGMADWYDWLQQKK
jgi:hydrogenase nickel incorporation protein HypB